MEILLVVAISVVVGALIYFNRSSRGLDINQDGKIDLADAKAAVDNAVSGVAKTLDVNQDGQVDVEDVKTAAKAVRSKASGAVSAAKRSGAKKPARKSVAKKQS